MEEYQYQMPEKKADKKEVIKTVGLIFVIGLVLIIYTFFPKNLNKAEKEYTKIVDKLCGSAVTYSELSGIEKNIPGETIYVRVGELQSSFLVSNNDLIDPRYDGEDAKISERAYVRLSLNQEGELYCEGLINNSNDNSPPIVNLKGSDTITVAKGTNFLDPGIKAVDDVDGDVSSRVKRSGTVDTNKEGEYKIKYVSSDMAGNTTELTRTIIVQNYNKLQETKPKLVDRISPRIEIKGNNPYCVKLGTKYIEPGVEARDNIDGNISSKVIVSAKINEKVSNNYRVTYKVSDSAGNKATAYRSIIVKEDCTTKKVEKPKATDIIKDEILEENIMFYDEEPNMIETTKLNTRPQISLLGETSINIKINEKYSDLGANAYDLEDGDITSKIKVDSSKVNINKGGIYTVYYEVSDSKGLIGKVERIVNVIDPNTTSNVARFNKTPQDLRIKLGHEDEIEVLTAKDSFNNNLNVEVEMEDSTGNKVNSVDYYKVGNYRIKYSARPAGGVLQMVDRKVEIYDDVQPVLFAPSTITETVKSENCEITEEYLFKKGITINDGNNKVMPKLIIENTINNLCNLNEEGFEISLYTVDASNNKSETKTINIIVKPQEVAIGDISVTNIELINCLKGKITLNTESLYQLDAIVYPLDATNKKVIWSSSDKDIVDVEYGSLKTTTVDGTVTIKAESEDGKKISTCEVEVLKKEQNAKVIAVESVEIIGCESGTITLEKGTTKLVSGKVKPENATNKLYTWTNSDYSVISPASGVTGGQSNGIFYLKAHKVGESTIELKSQDGNKVSTCKIIVNDIPSVVDTTAPSKVVVKSNNVNKTDPYNKVGTWYGGTGRKEIKLSIESIEKESKITKYQVLDNNKQLLNEYYPLVSNNNVAEIYWTKDINKEVYIVSVNSEGLVSEPSDVIVLKLDNTGPTTTFTSWIDNANTWTKEQSVKVKYTSKDSLNGILKYEYTHDDVKAKELSDIKIEGTTSSIELTFNESNLNKYVYVRAVDTLGNVGPWTERPSYLNMDSRPPKAPTINILNNNTTRVIVGFGFEDDQHPITKKMSGFGKFEYKLNSNPLKEILIEKETFEITTEGTHRVDAWSYDKAGNKSAATYKDNIKVLAGDVNAASITLKTLSAPIKTKESKTLTATVLPSNTTNKQVKWSSSDETVAIVNQEGVVKGISTGVATIIAKTTNDLVATTEVYVDLTKKQMEYIEAGTLKLTYELFGASGNGRSDDSQEIRLTHDYANKLYAEKNKLITVYGTKGKKYKIGALTEPILVITNVDWRNATLIFEDSNLTEEQLNINIFKISTPLYYKTGKDYIILKDDSNIVLNKSTTKFNKAIDLINSFNSTSDEYIELKKCDNYYVEAENTNINQYKRYGENVNDGKPQFDSFKIDSSGNVLNDVIWDFSAVTTLKVYPIYNNRISIKNADIETKVKNGTDYYIRRAIGVYRSNTLIKNIDHTLTNENSKGNKYGGFLSIRLVSDITIDQVKFSPHLGRGTYDLGIYKGINLTFNNCNVYKLTDPAPWGVWGGNYQKDIVVNNSKFNRIDAHSGIWNLTVNDSTLGTYGIAAVGGGLLKVTNTTFDKSRGIGLRTDYGSTWNGTVELNKVTFNPSSSTAYLINGSKANHDFGYDTYFPKVTINDLTINGTSDVYLFGYTQSSKYKPYTFNGNISLTNIKSINGIGIFDNDFTSNYLKLSSHKDQTVIRISLTDVKLKQQTDIAKCKILGTNCKLKFSILNKNVDISLNPNNKGKSVPTDFLGFSTERESLCKYMNNYQSNSVLQNLYKNLSPAVWRIGGNTVESVNWNKNTSECDTTTINSKLVDNVFSFANKVNWKIIYGINLKNNNLSRLKDETKYVLSKYNSSLHSMEIGNEPDLYEDMSVSDYQKKWTKFATEIKTLPYEFKIIGPSSIAQRSNQNAYRLEFFENFINNSKDHIASTSFHFYPVSKEMLTSTNNNENLKVLLDKDLLEKTKKVINDFYKISRKNSLPIRLAETNIGGDFGVSDSYASTLWTIDYLFNVLDSGIKGVNFHGYHLSTRNHYSPIWATGNVPFATPEYYGMLLFKQAASNGYSIPLNIDTSLNVSAYAIENNNKKLQLVIINKELTDKAVVKVNTNINYKSASAIRLTAPSLSTKITSPTNSQVKLGGKSVNADGSWSPNSENISINNAYSTIVVPPISAILVTFEP